MEEQIHQNALLLTSMAFGMNASDQTKDEPNRLYFLADEMDGIHSVPLTLTEWVHCQQTAPSYVEFLAENGISEIQKQIPYSNPCMAPGFQPVDSFLDLDAQKESCLRPHNGVPVNNLTIAAHTVHVQREQAEDHWNASQPHASVPVAARGVPPKPRSRLSRQRASAADRRRRERIAERLDSLQALLPPSKEGGKASAWDDIVDHIKSLQFQLKDLCQNRLGGEPTSDPFFFLEGYGHYLLHEQIVKQLNHPMEDAIGKLMETNPSATAKLLESRGLFLMPMALAGELSQAP